MQIQTLNDYSHIVSGHNNASKSSHSCCAIMDQVYLVRRLKIDVCRGACRGSPQQDHC